MSNKNFIIGMIAVISVLVILSGLLVLLPSNSDKATVDNKQTPINGIQQVKFSERKVKVRTEPQFASFMDDMQSKIKKNWNPPKQKNPAVVVMKYQIKKDGQLGDYSVETSSGIKEMDDAAIDALKKAAPFSALPQDYEGDILEVTFTFNYEGQTN